MQKKFQTYRTSLIMSTLPKKKHTLIIRYHRIGDALIALPLIRSLCINYPHEEFSVITHPFFAHLSDFFPKNLHIIPMQVRAGRGFLRGIKHLIKRRLFYHHLHKKLNDISQVIYFQFDNPEQKLHKQIATKFPHLRFEIANSSAMMDSIRLQTQCNDGISIIKIYQEALKKLGYTNTTIPPKTDNPLKNIPIPEVLPHIPNNKTWIAISPFSKEKSKTYPPDKMEQIIAHYASTSHIHILILGGGPREESIAKQWEKTYPNTTSLIDKLSFRHEAHIISHCKAIIAMDSFNMHLGLFLDIPVVSIWGPTTPNCGYYPPYLPKKHIILQGLPCQPCSFFGEIHCHTTPLHACMNIHPDRIIQEIDHILCS